MTLVRNRKSTWIYQILISSLLTGSLTILVSPNAIAAGAISFEELSTCADEYLDKLPAANKIQKCVFTGTELLFVNKFPKSKVAANIKIYFETKVINETSLDSINVAFDKPGQYNFEVEATDKSLKSRTLISENFYVLDPPVLNSQSRMATAQSISEQKQSYLVTYRDSSVIGTLESNYGFITIDQPSMNSNSSLEENLFVLPKGSKSKALGTLRISLTPEQASLLKSDSRILMIEKNAIIKANETQSSPPWNLDRIDQSSLPLNSQFNYPTSSFVPTVYVLDSGLRYTHQEFTNRIALEDCLYFSSTGATTCDDLYGHGTHVTGTVAGTKSGAAKNAKIKFIRLTGNGSSSTTSSYIFSAFGWAINDHLANDPTHQAVLNLSYGGSSASYAAEKWMSALTQANIIPVVSAGNSSLDSCNSNYGFTGYDPYNLAVSVGATDRFGNTDELAYFSNYGPCVSIYAPGVDIISASISSNSAFISYQGTSMSSPLVAGAIAKFISVHPSATRVDVIDWLYATSRKNIIQYLDDSSNNLFLSLISNSFAPDLVIANPPETLPGDESIVLDVENSYGGPITYSVTGTGCVISGVTLSANRATTCSVVANKAAGGYFAKLTSPAVSFIFEGVEQATLEISNATKTGPAGTAITLTTTGGSGAGAVTYAVTGDGCSVTAAALKATKPTTCTVIATKAANGVFASASSLGVEFEFTIANQAALVISNSNKNGIAGTPITLTTTGGSGAGAVTYATSSDGCSITAASLNTTKPTTCVVSASKAANGIYASVTSASTSFTIAAATQATLTISNATKTAVAGNSITLTSAGGSGSGAVTFTTATDGCAISTAALTVTRPATCVVIATKAANGIFAAANSAAVNFTFTAAPQSTLTVSNATKTAVAGETITLTSAGGSGEGAVSFATTTSGCAISGTSLTVTALTTCLVTATKAANGIYASATSAAVGFTFTVAAQSTLEISNATKTGPAGTAITLTTTGGSGAGAVSYATTTTGCSVSGALLNATALTTCVVRATKAASGIYAARTSADARFEFTIANQAALVISNTSKSGVAGTAITLTTTGGSGAGAVTYATSSDGCSITAASLNTTKPTTCVVSASKAANGIYASVTSASTSFTIASATQPTAISITNATATKTGTAGTAISLTATGGSGSGAIEFQTSTDGCSITGDLKNQLTTTKPAICSVTAKKLASGIYAEKISTAVSFTLKAAPQGALTISNATLSGTAGTDITLTATGGSGTESIDFQTTTTGCSITGTSKNKLTTTKPVTCSVTARNAANGIYAEKISPAVNFLLDPATQSTLEISNATKTGPAGTAIALTTTGGSGAGAVSYATSGTGCSVTATNKLNASSATTCVVTATKAASGIYASAKSVAVNFVFSGAIQSTLTIANTTLAGTAGTAITLVTSGGEGEGVVSYATTGTDCSVTAPNKLNASSATVCEVTATKAADKKFEAATSVSKLFMFFPLLSAPSIGSKKTPTSFQNLSENLTGIPYAAWAKSAAQINLGSLYPGNINILTGPNTNKTVINPQDAIHRTSKMYSASQQPGKISLIYYSRADIVWAQTQFNLMMNNGKGSDGFEALNNCQVGQNCWGASAWLNSINEGVVLIAVGVTDSNHTSGTLESHEFTHVIQLFQSPSTAHQLPRWLLEGGAQWSQGAALYSSIYSEYQQERKRNTGEIFRDSTIYNKVWITNFLSESVSSGWSNQNHGWRIYDIGSLATETLVALKGPTSVINLYVKAGTGMTWAQAFKAEFGSEWIDVIPFLADAISKELAGNPLA